MKGGLTEHVQTFLPPLDDEKTQTDIEALKIWSALALRQHSDKKVAEWLEKAWQINQWIVGLEKVDKKDKDRALSKLIEHHLESQPPSCEVALHGAQVHAESGSDALRRWSLERNHLL